MSSPISDPHDLPRPSTELLRSAWQDLFSDPLISTSQLKARALSTNGLGESDNDGGIILRSVYWRFYHNLLPTPTSLDLFAPSLQTSRSNYHSLQHRYLLAPDGRWATDCSTPNLPPTSNLPSTSTSSSTFSPPSTQSTPTPTIGEGWDPLSLEGTSPWKTWFTHRDLRTTILQDVERTFPDLEYFKNEEIRRKSVTMLFLYAVLNPDVGYRQGMHELLAVCLMVVDRDSIVNTRDTTKSPKSPLLGSGFDVEEAMYTTLDRRFVEHDTFELFCAVMKGAKSTYEWRAEEGPRSKSPSKVQAPIIQRCNNLHSSYLRRIDPQLWERLETEGVEAQLWAIRWIRLIFTRELPLPIALRIWDGVFAEDPGLALLDFVCIAMLLLIRNELLEADYPTLLTSLLRYPAPSETYPFDPNLIVSQAIFLRSNITPAAGVEVVIQNQDILGVRAQPPEVKLEDTRMRSARGRGGRGGIVNGSIRGRGGPRVGVNVGGIAAGLYERAQAAGLDKAILSTVADIRKNIPDSAYSYLPNLPFSPLQPPNRDSNTPFSSIPTSATLPYRPFSPAAPSPLPGVIQRESIDSSASIKTIRDAEREVAELRLSMVGMGKAMSEWLEKLQTLGGEEGKALEGLGRVRDTLLDAAGKGVDEIVKEWGWHEGLEAGSSRAASFVDLHEELPDEPSFVDKPIQLTPTVGTSSTFTGSSILPESRTPTLSSFRQDQPYTRGHGYDTTSSGLTVSSPKLAGPSRVITPQPGLVRVPLHQRLASATSSASKGKEAAAPVEESKDTKPISSSREIGGPCKLRSEEKEVVKGDGDPLAGLGVGLSLKSPGSPEWHGRRSRVGGGDRGRETVDPLLGVGVR